MNEDPDYLVFASAPSRPDAFRAAVAVLCLLAAAGVVAWCAVFK